MEKEFKIGSVTFKLKSNQKAKKVREFHLSGGLFYDDTLLVRHSEKTSEYFCEFISSEDGVKQMYQIPYTNADTSIKEIFKLFLEKFTDEFGL